MLYFGIRSTYEKKKGDKDNAAQLLISSKSHTSLVKSVITK